MSEDAKEQIDIRLDNLEDYFSEEKKIAKQNDLHLDLTKRRIEFFKELTRILPKNDLRQDILREWMLVIELTAKEEWGDDTMVEYDPVNKTFTVQTWNRKMEI